MENCIVHFLSAMKFIGGLKNGFIPGFHSDRVLCHFCFKPKKVTNEVLGIDNARKSQILISSVILLKTALDALPLLSKVHLVNFLYILSFFISLIFM